MANVMSLIKVFGKQVLEPVLAQIECATDAQIKSGMAMLAESVAQLELSENFRVQLLRLIRAGVEYPEDVRELLKYLLNRLLED